MKVSIILPTYNESESIIFLINKIKKCVIPLKTKFNFEIIVVDDDSPDKTGELVKKKFKEDKTVKVFIRKKNRDLGKAIGYGIQKSTGEIILGMDADGNHPPESIGLLLSNINDYHLVNASRFLKGGGMEGGIIQYSGSLIINTFLRILGFPIWDNTSGFYCIRKKDIKKLGFNKIYFGYGDYHLRLVYLAKKQHYKIIELPVFYPKRYAGKSKSNFIKMFFQYSWVAIKLRFSF